MPEDISCPFCPASTSRPVIEENGFTGRQCATCGLIFVSPRPSRAEMAEFYAAGDAYLPPEFFTSNPSTLTGRVTSWHHLHTVKRHVTGGSLLEIGPGGGTFLATARRNGFDVYGVELNSDQAQFIRDHHQIPCVTSLQDAHQLGPALFDVVYSRDVLSHFYDPIEDMREINALIRPGGWHIFETGNLGDVDQRHFGRMDAFQYPDHLFFYSQRSLGALLGASGLEHVKTYHYSILLQQLIQSQIRRVTHRNELVSQAHGQSRTVSQPRPPSHSGVLVRDALDLAYFGVQVSLGRIAARRSDPQTLIVVSRKAS